MPYLPSVPLDMSETRWVDPDHETILPRLINLPNTHDCVPVAVGGLAAPVDTKMAEVIYWLWKMGIPTSSSCEDVTDNPYVGTCSAAYLVFPSLVALDAFMRIAHPLARRRNGRRWFFDVWEYEGDIQGGVWLPQPDLPLTLQAITDELAPVLADPALRAELEHVEWVSEPHAWIPNFRNSRAASKDLA